MRSRYNEHMQEIIPSDKFLRKLESDMNRELRRKRHFHTALPKHIAVVAAVVAVVLVAAVLLSARPPQPDRQQPSVAAPGESPSTAGPTTSPTTTPSAVNTGLEILGETIPMPASDVNPLMGWSLPANETVPIFNENYEEQSSGSVPDDQEITVPADYPPEDEPWGLEILAEGVWPTEPTAHVTSQSYQAALMFENHLVGGGSENDYVTIHESPDGSAILAELHPGDAYWPAKGIDMQIIYDEKGQNAGYAEQVMWLGSDNILHTGWKRKLYSDAPAKQASENPVVTLARPGRVRADGTALRYGKNAEAPVVAVLEEGAVLGLQAQVGNWVYASTELFRKDGEQPVTGWIHVTEVVGLHWNVSIDHVDLTVDKANIRDLPDGKIIGTVTKNDASGGSLRYLNITVPGKEGDWHYVSLNGFNAKDGALSGWIFADLTKLYTFPLRQNLSMENVVSATLAYAPTELYPDVDARSQTVTGEKLARLLERMENAVSEAVHTPVCGDGVATITLAYSDGHEEITYLAADSCPQLRYGDVTYDLRSEEERSFGYMQEYNYSLHEILGPLFDEIAFL